MIANWDEYLDAWFEEDENGNLGVNQDLRPRMTPRFRRKFDRAIARTVGMTYGCSKRYVEVTALKRRARRRRKRR